MKTAMKEFLEWLENSSDVQNDILNWEIVKENALEKEKEQIVAAREDGNMFYLFKSNEQYLKQTYNN